MYAWKFNSKLRMFKVKRSDPGEGLLTCTGFLLGMMKMSKNWLEWQTLSQLCECAKKHCILYSKRANCMITIVSYTHTYISCSVCSILISLLLGYTAVEAIAAVTNNNDKNALSSTYHLFSRYYAVYRKKIYHQTGE